MSDDESAYEDETREKFYLGPDAYLAWRDFHRATLARLFNDPRMTEDAKQAVREYL